VVRYLGVDTDPVNWGWLCDKGRFGFEAIHHEARLTEPLIRGESRDLEAVRWTDALSAAAEAILAGLSERGPEGLAVVGGARLTNESAYAWTKLAKGVLGTDHVDCQLGDGLPPELVLGTPRATIDEVCTPGGTVVVLAPDLKEELPVLYLRLRHAVVNDGVQLIEISPRSTGLSSHAAVSLHPRPGEAGEVVRSILGSRFGSETGGVAGDDLARAAALLVERPVRLVVGRPAVSESSDAVVDAVAELVRGIDGLRVLPVLRRANVNGALDMGLTPGFLPGRVQLDEGRDWYSSHWATVPGFDGLDTTGILEAAAGGRIDTLVLLGADLDDFPDRDLADRALEGARKVIAVDLFLTDSARRADVVLPAAGFAEIEGTTTNIEGRISAVAQKVTAPGTARGDWMIAAELAFRLRADLGIESTEDIWAEIERLSPVHHGITWTALHAPTGRDGVVAGVPERSAPADTNDVSSRPEPVTFDADRMPHTPPPLDAYGLRLVATRKLYDCGTLVQHAPSLAGLAPGTEICVNAYDFDRLGVDDGDEVRVSSAKGELIAEIRVDDGVTRGTAAMVFRQPELDVAELIDATSPVTDIRVETS
jgi:NADH-quinone oxidoreductase subunit G